MAFSLSSRERLPIRDTAKFGILTALCAIFIDASIAHGLFWDNDPYWTYWITKTFLIATVFTMGTAFLGVGIVQGLIVTAVHTAILEVYYQWFSPVGLPQEPEWLDTNHVWVTGVPVHYLAILTGYFIALWIWRRGVANDLAEAPAHDGRGKSAGSVVLSALVTGILILVLSGIVTHALLLGEFPGPTYFIQHLLIGFVFLYLWSAYVGMSGGGWAIAALMLSLTWTTYSMYLGPTGLPGRVQYLGYHQLWLRAFPGDFISALAGLFIAGRLLPGNLRRAAPVASGVLALLLLFLPDKALAKPTGPQASASASGDAHRVTGPNPVDLSSSGPVKGSIAISVIEGGNRWSHVQNQDAVNLDASFTAPDGRYRIVVDRPMPRHPLGRYTTWNGVAFNHAMHGGTGIGTSRLPLMKPEISIYGWGKVWRDGELLAAMAPVHAMVTSKGPMAGVMLEVDTEEKALRDVAGGYLTVHWPVVANLSMPHSAMLNRELLGWAALIALALRFGWLAAREQRTSGT